MTAPKPWSLARRLTAWIALVTILPMLCAFLVGGLFLESLAARELEALAVEETIEIREALRHRRQPLDDFASVCEALAAHHPEARLAWRVFDQKTGSVLVEHGAQRLLDADTHFTAAVGVSAHIGRGLVARTVEGPAGMLVGLVVDGSHRLRLLAGYWTVAAVLAVLTSIVALLASRRLARRVAGLVTGVADDVCAARRDHRDPRAAPGAPDEILAVVEALCAEMKRIREESERARIFTAGLAHELRSPLQNLIGQAEVTLQRPRDPQAYEQVLGSQVEELSELSDAVDNLLTMCRSSEGSPGGATEDFDLATEARLRLDRERVRAHREGLDLDFLVAGDTRMAGDREAVLRGLRNVVANAIDWSPRGGRVRVSIEGADDNIVVTVDDSGPGIPVEVRQRVFEPFYKGPARDRKRQGYGLGLSIAKASVEEHGGRLDVETSSLGGARFRLTFSRRVRCQDRIRRIRDHSA